MTGRLEGLSIWGSRWERRGLIKSRPTSGPQALRPAAMVRGASCNRSAGSSGPRAGQTGRLRPSVEPSRFVRNSSSPRIQAHTDGQTYTPRVMTKRAYTIASLIYLTLSRTTSRPSSVHSDNTNLSWFAQYSDDPEKARCPLVRRQRRSTLENP